MATIPNQPTIPASPLTDLEKVFISEAPPGLWPQNSDSNFGAVRRTLLAPFQDAVDLITGLYYEMFVNSSDGYIGLWEDEVGLPRGDTYPIWFRRVLVLNRLAKGPFTRTRRKNLVEAFIIVTFGDPIKLFPDGVALTAGGVPIYGETLNVTSSYSITENITGFSYVVNVIPAVDLDQTNLTRELRYITPAHYSFTITRT